jgi:hypothetical protein
VHRIRILRNLSNDRVNLRLFASRNRWEAEMFDKLADLMQKYELLELHLPLGVACLEIEHLPLQYLEGILVDLQGSGFSIECPLTSKRR